MTPPLHADPGAFAGLSELASYADARFAVLPLPYDATASFQKGAARGPEAVIEVSPQLEMYDIETGCEPCRHGIVTMAAVPPAATPAANVARIRDHAAGLIADGKTVVGLGGDHSVTIGLVQAHAAAYPGLSVLQLDAHTDTRDSYEGTPYSHASVMARVAELCPYLQVGIRAMDLAEVSRITPGRTFFAHDHDEAAVLEAVRTRLTGPVYVTVDIDVLDPAEMPATGTPEPGGLRYRQVLSVLREVCRHHEVVGFDVVELMPLPGSRAPEFLVARLVYQMMAYLVTYQPRS
ncbi:MAG: agmatinase [Candidatus Krumholzibacteriia bacterium]